jgi:hypothetical protein
MKRSITIFAVALAVGLTLASGIVQGVVRHRWGPSREMRAAAERVQGFPAEFGGESGRQWRLRSTETMSERALEMLECAGYFIRTYENQQSGSRVTATMLVGPTGTMVSHTPEVCFVSNAHQQRGASEEIVISGASGGEGEFRTMTFDPKEQASGANTLRVYYAWSSGGAWSAEDSKLARLFEPYLYKIQISSVLASGDDPEADDACRAFLRDFIPVAEKVLVAPAAE